MEKWFCWVLLMAVLIYFFRIDRKLQRTLTELEWFRAQLKPWGFVAPDPESNKR